MAKHETDKSQFAPTATGALDAWRKVYMAYTDAMPPNLEPGQAQFLASIAKNWVENIDPSEMDVAISYCHQKGLPILPELLKHVHEAMQKRLADGSSGKKAFKKAAKKSVLEEMAKFVYWGASITRAAELGAYISHCDGTNKLKASTLEKEYARQRSALEAFARDVFDSDDFPDSNPEKTELMWRRIIDAKIKIPQELIGERR